MTSASIRATRPPNRRAADRYAFRTPLRYRAADSWLSGHTIDMSAGGILIEIAQELPLGTRLEILMDWPGLYFAKKKVRLFLIGSIMRVDHRGTALRIVRHQFRDIAVPRHARKGSVLPAAMPSYAVAGRAPIGA